MNKSAENLLIFTKEIHNGKLHILCSDVTLWSVLKFLCRSLFFTCEVFRSTFFKLLGDCFCVVYSKSNKLAQNVNLEFQIVKFLINTTLQFRSTETERVWRFCIICKRFYSIYLGYCVKSR